MHQVYPISNKKMKHITRSFTELDSDFLQVDLVLKKYVTTLLQVMIALRMSTWCLGDSYINNMCRLYLFALNSPTDLWYYVHTFAGFDVHLVKLHRVWCPFGDAAPGLMSIWLSCSGFDVHLVKLHRVWCPFG